MSPLDRKDKSWKPVNPSKRPGTPVPKASDGFTVRKDAKSGKFAPLAGRGDSIPPKQEKKK